MVKALDFSKKMITIEFSTREPRVLNIISCKFI